MLRNILHESIPITNYIDGTRDAARKIFPQNICSRNLDLQTLVIWYLLQTMMEDLRKDYEVKLKEKIRQKEKENEEAVGVLKSKIKELQDDIDHKLKQVCTECRFIFVFPLRIVFKFHFKY